MGLGKMIKGFFTKSEKVDIGQNDECSITSNIYDSMCKIDRFELFDRLDLENVAGVKVIGDLNDGRPIIFIMDDFEHVMSMYEYNFGSMPLKNGKTIYDEFNIVMAMGKDSGFIAYKYIKNGGRIDYAFLDITMVSVIKFNDGETLDIDGIDIGIEINKRQSATKIVFPTAHTMNIKIPQMKYYIDKMIKYFECDSATVNKYFVDKNGVDILERLSLFLGRTGDAD